MAANLTIDKIFADNLGTAFGGCVRDQSLNLFSPEIARSAGANWNPLPFFGRAEKVRFRAAGQPSCRASDSGRHWSSFPN